MHDVVRTSRVVILKSTVIGIYLEHRIPATAPEGRCMCVPPIPRKDGELR